MARRTDQSIHLGSTRENLPPRREPYWRCLSKGAHLGFRKSPTGTETFVARWRDRNGRRQYNALGSLPYADAKELAEQWIADCRSGINSKVTVRGCLDAYVANLRCENREATAADSEQRFHREVYGSVLATIRLVDLCAHDIQSWRNSLRSGRSPATVNRSLACLKAALNYGFRQGMVRTDQPWKVVERLKVDEQARLQYLSIEERQSLLRHSPDDLALFLKALMFTGARPGGIARCRVEDFEPKTGALILRSNKGGRKKVSTRTFVLCRDGLNFFQEQHRWKLPRAFLFTTSEGRQWVKWLWSRPLRSAVQHAGLPDGTTAYVIRHSIITDWIQHGLDVGSVAKAAGTSIQMINDHYFKYVPDRTADQFAAVISF